MNKFIIVPPSWSINRNGELTSPQSYSNLKLIPQTAEAYINGTLLPVTVMNPNQGYASDFMYNPIMDYVDWYSDGIYSYNTAFVATHTFKTKVWHRRELSDWVDENCEAEVIVQRSGDGWNLTFVRQSDYQNFNMWWMCKQKQLSVVIACAFDEMSKKEYELKNWCSTNLKQTFDIQRGSNQFDVYVKDTEEAVHFKLRWFGSED